MMNEQLNIDPKLIEEMLASVDRSSPWSNLTPQDGDPTEFDFTSPNLFTAEHKDKTADFLASVKVSIEQSLQNLFQEKVQVDIQSWSLEFLTELQKQSTSWDQYGVSIEPADCDQSGLLLIDPVLALQWISLCLGGLEMELEDRPISELETALITDAITEVMKSFSVVCEMLGGNKTKAVKNSLSRRDFKFKGEPIDEYIRINMIFHNPFANENEAEENEKPAESKDQDDQENTEETQETGNDSGLPFSIIVPIASIAKAVELKTYADYLIPSQESQLKLVDWLQEAAVNIDVFLGKSNLHLRDIVELEPGDVLVLDHKTDMPISAMIDDIEIAQGFPVTSAGRYALQLSCNIGDLPIRPKLNVAIPQLKESQKNKLTPEEIKQKLNKSDQNKVPQNV